MTAEVTFQGIGVSGGIVIAPVFLLPKTTGGQRTAGSHAQEKEVLEQAIAQATVALESLMTKVSEDAADILEFQVALLDDEDLLAPIYDSIAEGVAADRAWCETLEREIADYAGGASDDEVFGARASDLADLRDRVLGHILGSDVDSALPAELSILLARDLAPSRFLEIDARIIAGIALGEGSRTSHVSLLARAKGLPLVVGLGALPEENFGKDAVLDAGSGRLVLHPSADTRTRASAQAREEAETDKRSQGLAAAPAVTASGVPVEVLVNIDHPSILDDVKAAHCDGIGLTRTEFLFQQGAPSEDSQLESYRRLIRWADGRSVTVRTLDAGGDKPLPGITRDGEANPFLGVRGLRLSLRAPDFFKVQLRALLRAAAEGPFKVMLPMVTEPSEIAAVRQLIDQVAGELEHERIAFARPALGMMVEVPAAALAAALFDVDFYSIGTNDLVQYATASARDNAEVAALARPDHPGVIRLIESVVAAGRKRGVEVSVCGDMASDPRDVRVLLDAGVRVLSVAPADIGRVKAAVAGYPEAA